MKISIAIATVILSIILLCCQKQDKDRNKQEPLYSPFKPQYGLTDLLRDTQYDTIPQINGSVYDITEASGLDISYRNPGKIWTHNDSGHGEYIFLLDAAKGEVLQTFHLRNVQNIDWEDICTYYDVNLSKSYIYIADIGSNSSTRTNYQVYRFEEPLYDSSQAGDTVEIFTIADVLQFQYPLQESVNAESIMRDPGSGNLLLATYETDSCRIFQLHPQSIEVKFLGTLPIGGVTAGDVMDSRNRIMLKTFKEIFVWDVLTAEEPSVTFSRKPRLLPYQGEPQGEALCWYNEGYFTLSEKVSSNIPILYYYVKK